MPKKSPGLKRLLQAITAEEVQGSDSTKLELLARQLVALAMAGDSMALREIFNRLPDDEDHEAPSAPMVGFEVVEKRPIKTQEALCHSSQALTKIAI